MNQQFERRRPRPTPTVRTVASDVRNEPERYLDEAAQRTIDALAQKAAREVIRALGVQDETTTWQRVRQLLRAPLATAYDEGAQGELVRHD